MIGARKFRTTAARKRERVRLVLVSVLWVIVVSTVLGGLWYVVHGPFLRIREVTISPETIVGFEAVRAAAGEDLAGSYLHVLPRDSILLPQAKRLSALLMVQFPYIRTVTVRRGTFHSLALTLEERTPDGLWCGDVVPPVATQHAGAGAPGEESWGACYFLDADAFMYARAPTFTGNVLPRFYGSLTHAEPIGQTYVDPPTYRAWRALYDRLHGADHTPDAILFVDERDAELYIGGARILVARDGDLNELWQHLEALLTGDIVDRTRPVAYIDLRTNAKAFVRYADDVGESESATTSSLAQ